VIEKFQEDALRAADRRRGVRVVLPY